MKHENPWDPCDNSDLNHLLKQATYQAKVDQIDGYTAAMQKRLVVIGIGAVIIVLSLVYLICAF